MKSQNSTVKEKSEYKEVHRQAPKNDDLILLLQAENAKLKEENEKYKNVKENLLDDMKKKKKVLLNELCNMVNTKNNFENSFYSELTKTSD